MSNSGENFDQIDHETMTARIAIKRAILGLSPETAAHWLEMEVEQLHRLLVWNLQLRADDQPDAHRFEDNVVAFPARNRR